MNFITKSVLLLSAAAILGGCVEDGSGYSGHNGYSYRRYSATSATSGYNSHYNKSNQTSQSGGYSGHSNTAESKQQPRRYYSAARTNNPPIGYRGPRSFGSSGANTYTGNGYRSGSSNEAPPSSTGGYAGR